MARTGEGEAGKSMKCSKCRGAISAEDSIGGYCTGCIQTMGSGLKKLSKDDLRRLREEVEIETSGLMSMEALRQMLEDMYDRLSSGEGFDEVIEETAIQIQRYAGLGMAKEMLKVTQALGSLALEQEEEIRKKMRKLISIGEKRHR